MANSIWLEFADGQYFFHLKNKRIDEVETKCQAGLGDIYARTLTGCYQDTDGEWVVMPTEARWKNAELVEVVRQGLIGGGKCVVDGDEKVVPDFRVNALIASYLEDRPRIELWKIAASVLHATMEGYEPPKKEEPVAPAGLDQSEHTTASSDLTDTPDT